MAPPKTRSMSARSSEATEPPDGPEPSKPVNAVNPSSKRGKKPGQQVPAVAAGQQVQAVAAVAAEVRPNVDNPPRRGKQRGQQAQAVVRGNDGDPPIRRAQNGRAIVAVSEEECQNGRTVNVRVQQNRDGDLEDSFYDDPDQGKTLNSKDGKYGFVTQRGFRDATNFLLQVYAFVYSENFRIKGYSFDASRPDSDIHFSFFVPEAEIYFPEKFKKWMDEAHICKRWHVSCPPVAWKQMILNKLSNFESSPGAKTLFLVEMVGNQIQTSSRNPTDLHYRRTVLNKNLFLDCNGDIDKNPIHYWHETLSEKVKMPRVLTPINCEVDETKNLEPLIKAAMPGNFWEHISTAAMVISSSNTDAVRTVCKQHPATVLVGPKGVGKTWCTDICYKILCGMLDYNKIDPASPKEAIKRIMAMSTFPPILEDITSSNKEENIVVSCFDLATYVCKGEQVTSKTMPIISTNVETRVERLIDREVIVKFDSSNATYDELAVAENLYKEAMTAKKVPVGFTVGYGAYVLSPVFTELLDYFTQMEMDVNQVKKRTARGYAIKDVAVKYIFDKHKEIFLSLGHPWEEYLEYIKGKQKDVIRYMHIELSRAVPLVVRFLDEILQLVSDWTMTERRRSLAMPESQKHLEKSKSKCNSSQGAINASQATGNQSHISNVSTATNISYNGTDSSYYRCPCGKICQSKRGLTEHGKTCKKLPNQTLALAFLCVKCGDVYSTAAGLSRHKTKGGAKCLAKSKARKASLSLALTISSASETSRTTTLFGQHKQPGDNSDSAQISRRESIQSPSAHTNGAHKQTTDTDGAQKQTTDSEESPPEQPNSSANLLSCSLCPMKCKNKGALGSHMKAKHKNLQRDEIASMLEKSQTEKAVDSVNLTDENQKEKAFNCTICGFVCKSKSGLTSHTRSRHGDSSASHNQSEVGVQPSIPLSGVSRRLSVTLGITEGLTSCEQCGFIAATVTGLKLHKLTHKKKPS